MNHHRTVKTCTNGGFVRRSKILAPRYRLERLDTVWKVVVSNFLVNQFDGIVIRNSREIPACRWLELGHITLENLEFGLAFLERPTHQVTDKIFLQFHVVLPVVKRHFGFDHPKLEQVTTGLAFLGAEGWTKSIDLAVCHRTRLGVQLPRLRKVSFFIVEQTDLEKIGRTLNRSWHEKRCVKTQESPSMKKIVNAALNQISHAQNRPRLAVAQMQVSVIE